MKLNIIIKMSPVLINKREKNNCGIKDVDFY